MAPLFLVTHLSTKARAKRSEILDSHTERQRLCSYNTIVSIGLATPYVRILRSRTYRFLWFGQVVSNFGDTLHYVALVVLLFRLTGSGAALATLSLAQIVSGLVLRPFAGVFVDRFDRRTLMIMADLIRAALAAALAFTENAPLAIALAVGMTVAGVPFVPAARALLPSLVNDDDLLAANTVSHSTEQSTQIVASALAGALLLTWGTTPAFLLNAASFAFSAAMLLRLPRQTRPDGIQAHGDDHRLLDRCPSRLCLRSPRCVRRPTARHSSLGGAPRPVARQLCWSFCRRATCSCRPRDFPGCCWRSALARWSNRICCRTASARIRASSFGRMCGGALGDILIALLTPLPIALGLLFLYGVGTSTGAVTCSTVLQRRVPDAVRGRVFATLDVIWAAWEIASIGLAGLIVDQVGIVAVYIAGGALLVAAGALGLLLRKRV